MYTYIFSFYVSPIGMCFGEEKFEEKIKTKIRGVKTGFWRRKFEEKIKTKIRGVKTGVETLWECNED